MKLRAIGICTALALAPVLAACGSDDDAGDVIDETSQTIEDTADDAREALDDAVDDASESIDEGLARARAETLRASIQQAMADDDENEARSIDLIEDRAESLPGDTELEGLEDSDDDGLDDDGEVTVRVGDSAACLLLPASGTEIDVEGGEC